MSEDILGRDATIGSKVDVGFVEKQSEGAGRMIETTPEELDILRQRIPLPKVNDVACKVDMAECRLEALKLAYEVAFKVNSFNFPIEFNKKTQEEQQSDYEDVLALADINYQFIVSGKTNID